MPNVSLVGTLGVTINNTLAPVKETFTAGGVTTTLDVPAGPFLRVAGTGLSLTVVGQTLAGDFSFEQATATDGTKLVKVAAANVSLGLGGNLLNVTNGSGLFLLTTAGLAGTLSATVALNVPNLSFVGTFGLSINNTTAAVNTTFTVGRVDGHTLAARRAVPPGLGRDNIQLAIKQGSGHAAGHAGG